MLVKAQERWLRKGSCRAEPNTSLYHGIQRRDSLAEEDHFVGIFGGPYGTLYSLHLQCDLHKIQSHLPFYFSPIFRFPCSSLLPVVRCYT